MKNKRLEGGDQPKSWKSKVSLCSLFLINTEEIYINWKT